MSPRMPPRKGCCPEAKTQGTPPKDSTPREQSPNGSTIGSTIGFAIGHVECSHPDIFCKEGHLLDPDEHDDGEVECEYCGEMVSVACEPCSLEYCKDCGHECGDDSTDCGESSQSSDL